MLFRAKTDTADGRLIKKRIYFGQIIHSVQMGLRICVYDNRKQWMTFDPEVFEPITEPYFIEEPYPPFRQDPKYGPSPTGWTGGIIGPESKPLDPDESRLVTGRGRTWIDELDDDSGEGVF